MSSCCRLLPLLQALQAQYSPPWLVRPSYHPPGRRLGPRARHDRGGMRRRRVAGRPRHGSGADLLALTEPGVTLRAYALHRHGRERWPPPELVTGARHWLAWWAPRVEPCCRRPACACRSSSPVSYCCSASEMPGEESLLDVGDDPPALPEQCLAGGGDVQVGGAPALPSDDIGIALLVRAAFEALDSPATTPSRTRPAHRGSRSATATPMASVRAYNVPSVGLARAPSSRCMCSVVIPDASASPSWVSAEA